MKRAIKAIKAFLRNSLCCLAPFTVRNEHFGKCHFCWSFSQALKWLSCYDARKFGNTNIHDFNGEIIATKSAVNKIAELTVIKGA